MQPTKVAPSRKKRRLLLLLTLKRVLLTVVVLLLCAFFFWHRVPPTESISFDGDGQQQRQHIRKALVIINRHGARSALRHYTFENVTWDVPLGQLSLHGMQQAFNVGAQLRTQYFSEAISMQRKLLDFKIFSTYLDRTSETARSMVLGFVYGSPKVMVDELSTDDCRVPHVPASYACLHECLGIPKESQWNGSLPDVRIIQKNNKKAGLMMQYERCKGFDQKLTEVYRAQNMSKIESRFAPQFEILREVKLHIVGGDEVCMDRVARVVDDDERIEQDCQRIDLHALERVWDNCVTMVHAGMPFSPIYKNSTKVLSSLEKAVEWKWQQEFTAENGRFAGGMLLTEIISHIGGILQKTKSRWGIRKFSPQPLADDELLQTVIFSAHDKTVASLLSAMGAEKWHLPGYVSHVSFLVTGPPEGAYFEKQIIEIRYDGQLLNTKACEAGRCSLKVFHEKTMSSQIPIDSCELVETVVM